jgi:N-acetylglucosamine-6-phosphate deacetylase
LLQAGRRPIRHAGVRRAGPYTAPRATPARLLGLSDVGDLVPGRRADVVVTDAELTPLAVMRAGRWVGSEPGREAV